MRRFYILFLSFILLLILILWVGPANILVAVKYADWRLILLAAATHILVIFIRSLRWGFIIDKKGDYVDNFIVKTIGLLAGNFSPMRSAGEILNAVAGKKINKISLSQGLSAGLTERFFDLGIVGVLLTISALFIPMVRWIALIGGLISIMVTFLIYLVNWREEAGVKLYEKFHGVLEKFPIKDETLEYIHEKFTHGIIDIREYTKSYSRLGNLLIIFILSLLSWILECIRLYIVFAAFNITMGFFSVVIIFLLANIISILSALPGGIGSMEISLTTLFILFGVPFHAAGSIALIDRLVSFWIVSVLGVIFSTYYAKEILEEIRSYILDLKG